MKVKFAKDRRMGYFDTDEKKWASYIKKKDGSYHVEIYKSLHDLKTDLASLSDKYKPKDVLKKSEGKAKTARINVMNENIKEFKKLFKKIPIMKAGDENFNRLQFVAKKINKMDVVESEFSKRGMYALKKKFEKLGKDVLSIEPTEFYYHYSTHPVLNMNWHRFLTRSAKTLKDGSLLIDNHGNDKQLKLYKKLFENFLKKYKTIRVSISGTELEPVEFPRKDKHGNPFKDGRTYTKWLKIKNAKESVFHCDVEIFDKMPTESIFSFLTDNLAQAMSLSLGRDVKRYWAVLRVRELIK